MAHAYEQGRLNLPFVGIPTFGKYPLQLDWDRIEADVAVLGAPFDFGTQWRAGARFGPRAIREASTLFSFGHAGAYDHEDDVVYLDRRPHRRHRRRRHHPHRHHREPRQYRGRRAQDSRGRGAAGGARRRSFDHDSLRSRPSPSEEPIHVVQFDAHLDFVDQRHGVRFGHGSPMRRAAERAWVTGLTQLGIRNVSSTAREGYEDARRMGSDILSVRQIRKLGPAAVLERIPADVRYYVTIDIDGFDPSIAAGTGTPSHGGFTYYEVLELVAGLARRGTVVGIDLVEVAPDYDHSGTTAILAAQLLLNFIGRVLYARGR